MTDAPRLPALTLVAAVARNGAIGRDNALLWHEPADLRHFRRVTTGHPVLMGRRTWDSLPPRFRPLPGRRNVVLTRQPGWRSAGADSADSLMSARRLLADVPRAFVIGGAEIYALALPFADTLILTEIEADLAGDTYFPAWDRRRIVAVDREPQTGADGTPFSFVTYQLSKGD